MVSEFSKDATSKYQMPNLDINNPPENLSYADIEDYRNREIVKANGIALSEAGLIDALEKTTNILQAAITHTLGSSIQPAVSKFKELLLSTEDLVKVEAAYSLARLGIPEGKDALVQFLDYPLDAYLFPAIAAGYLAQLNDSKGFKTIV